VREAGFSVTSGRRHGGCCGGGGVCLLQGYLLYLLCGGCLCRSSLPAIACCHAWAFWDVLPATHYTHILCPIAAFSLLQYATSAERLLGDRPVRGCLVLLCGRTLVVLLPSAYTLGWAATCVTRAFHHSSVCSRNDVL
jgi:hypothetical protein